MMALPTHLPFSAKHAKLCRMCAAFVPLCCMYQQPTSWAVQQTYLPILWLACLQFLGKMLILRLHVYTGGVITQMASHSCEN